MKSTSKNPRREFIKNSIGSVAALTIIPRYVLGGKGFTASSDKVNIAIVGAGIKSFFNIRQLFNLDDVRLTAVADPAWLLKDPVHYSSYRGDTGRGPAKKFIEEFYSPKTPNFQIAEYEDFRVMLEKEKSLDAIVCCTPDNTHAYVSILAMRAGKHVYTEKPLAHNIWEARKMRDVARDTGMATQMGNEGHSYDGLREIVEYLRAGAIGTVRESHSWVPATRWLLGLKGFPDDITPIPEGFDWDLWLGPTSWRPYNSVYASVKWRDFWAFGCGALGDFGCHDMDSATWAFNLHNPESVEVTPAGNSGSRDIAPYGEIGYFRFAADGEQPPFRLTWYSGGLRPSLPDLLPCEFNLGDRGSIFVGDKGIILVNEGCCSTPLIFPESLRNTFTPPAPSLPRSKGHFREWVDAIKGGPAASSNFEYATRLTEIVLLGVLSLRLGGEKIYWDTKNMKATGLPEADEIIREPARKGWEMD